MLPGDALVLLDGRYTQALRPAVSGTVLSPITIRSVTDGGAIIDGELAREPCVFRWDTDLVIVGIRCERSSGSVVIVRDAERIELQRVSAHEATGSNRHIFYIHMATDVLLEDVAASGFGTFMYVSNNAQRVTLRRCFGRWQQSAPSDGGGFVNVSHDSADARVENCVGFGEIADNNSGITVGSADRVVVQGNVVRGVWGWAYFDGAEQKRTEGNRFVDNVALENRLGMFQRGDVSMRVDRMTFAGTLENVFAVSPHSIEPKDADFAIYGELHNTILLGGNRGINVSASSYITGFVNDCNNLFGLTSPYYGQASPGPNDISVDPGFDVARYGRGAYLAPPLLTCAADGSRIGAEVLYRFRDGELTEERLWPWPMEDRIFAEQGISVTWEAHGGIWSALTGLYP